MFSDLTKISLVTLPEIDQLKSIGRQTFYETFVESSSKKDMQQYLDNHFSTQILTSELSNTASQFYFAKIKNQVVGYLKINWAQSQTEANHETALEIERIYVLRGHFDKKIGQLLCDKAIHIAQEKNLEYVWLGVWEHNSRAITFYKKNGFIAFDKHIFTVGTDNQTDMLMKLKL